MLTRLMLFMTYVTTSVRSQCLDAAPPWGTFTESSLSGSSVVPSVLPAEQVTRINLYYGNSLFGNWGMI